jgi:hypothetical protein
MSIIWKFGAGDNETAENAKILYLVPASPISTRDCIEGILPYFKEKNETRKTINMTF